MRLHNGADAHMMKILIPDENALYKTAAEELISFYSRVTSRKPEITFDRDAECDTIVLGGDWVNRFSYDCIIEKLIPRFRVRFGSDDYEFRSARKDSRNLLFIAGGSGRAVFYGIYRFFELAANCRYFWDGDIIPTLEKIDITGWDIYEKPHFEYRGMRYFAHRGLHRFQAEHWDFEDWRREIDFLLKKRFNLFMLRIGLDDLFQKAFPEQVPYPMGYEIEASIPRSYDDHTLFMPLEERGALRKKVLDYAFERGLMHPEDIGPMTHWYSRTPMNFIRAFHPAFMPQAASGYYGDPTGRIWDIRDDANLERYYALTRTHIQYYGSPRFFHTIGLSERHCCENPEEDHQMKLYTYGRIIERLRRDYPDAPLLIASWEFLDWRVEEVRELLALLNPENTVILDYVTDIQEEHNYFVQWDLPGRRKWIFGIFHSNENNSELRGNYPLIQERLRYAAADPMCKGLVLWPETSHADTLMIEYVASNSWNPVHIGIDSFVVEFCSARYPEKTAEMLTVWRMVLPSIKKRIRFAVGHEKAIALMFFIRALEIYSCQKNDFLKRYSNTLGHMLPALADIPALFGRLASLSEAKDCSAFMSRDLLDIAKSAAASILDTGWAAINVGMDNWRNGAGNAEALRTALSELRKGVVLLAKILSASEEFSLYDSLSILTAGKNRNPSFEDTLKGNAENSYSRSFIPEILIGCTIPELDVFSEYVGKRLASGIRGSWNVPEDFPRKRRQIQDVFYETKLRNFAPDFEAGRKELPSSLRLFGETAVTLLVFAGNENTTAQKGVF